MVGVLHLLFDGFGFESQVEDCCLLLRKVLNLSCLSKHLLSKWTVCQNKILWKRVSAENARDSKGK